MSEDHKIKIRINELLEERSKTLYWLARQSGVPYQTIHRIGKRETDSISYAVLDKICDALNVEPGEIIVREN